MKRFTPALLFLVLAASPALAADFAARVVGISDGDTLTVLRTDKTQVKVRLWGIDAPETGQPFGAKAKQAASELAFGKDVTIRERDKDRYGRTVAEVILPDGHSMGREMTGRGYAWWYSKYSPAERELGRLEAEAKAAKVGLWSQPGAIPPWEWRNGVGVPVTTEVVGKRRSHVFHSSNCRAASSMKPENRVAFRTAAEAEAAGYRRAGDCR